MKYLSVTALDAGNVVQSPRRALDWKLITLCPTRVEATIQSQTFKFFVMSATLENPTGYEFGW
jgi:hypothetical protein